MFGMGLWEILLIVLLVLVVMGPEKIPEAARLFGKGVREVRKMSNLLRDAVDLDLDEPPPKMQAAGSGGMYESGEDFEMDEPGGESFESDKPKELFAVPMESRRSTDLLEVALTAPVEPEMHREVYLHVPFEETI